MRLLRWLPRVNGVVACCRIATSLRRMRGLSVSDWQQTMATNDVDNVDDGRLRRAHDVHDADQVPSGSTACSSSSEVACADTWPILQWMLGRLIDTTRKAIRLQNRAEAMQRLTMTDELTGLYNRRGFLVMARQQLRLGARNGRCMSLFVVDVDRLKTINDTLGHCAGDEVLKRVGDVLIGTFRQSDIVARLGGDEFVVLAVDAAQTNQRAIAARFEQGIELHNRRSGVVRFSMSIGSVRFEPREARRVEDLIRRADSRMYSHKHARRGTA